MRAPEGRARETVTSVTSPSASAAFEPDGRAAAAARRFVRDTLLAWNADDVVDDAVLLTSELVTNAVVHAGTIVEVACLLEPASVLVEVHDLHPGRRVPDWPGNGDTGDESGRGLLVSATLAAAWGVTYTKGRKTVWFRLDRHDGEQGITAVAAPVASASQVPPLDGRPRVALVRTDEEGCVVDWNDEAAEIAGYPAGVVPAAPLADVLSLPGGSALQIRDIIALARWQGDCTLRQRDGRELPVFASVVRCAGEDGAAGAVWLVVERHHRALVETPVPVGAPAGPRAPAILPDALAARLSLDEMMRRTVESARDILDGDASYLLLARENETELELRASSGVASAVPSHGRLAAEEILGGLGASRLPAIYDDVGAGPVAAALLRGTGMRSLLTVPLLVEGHVIGVLCVAAEQPGWFDNEGAVRLQEAADRIALVIERARLAELERASRGWLSFLAEASDLLAGTLDEEMTLALVAQLVVPRLATWCAVHVRDDLRATRLAYVWHADESRLDALRSLLGRVAPPADEPVGERPLRAEAAPLEPGAGDDPAAPDLSGDLVISLPLLAKGRSLGALTLGRPAGDRFPREVVALAEDLSRRAAVALDNARLYSERAATSRALQQSLLPPDVPEMPGVDLAVLYTAAGSGNEVGGDFYDVFAVADDRWRFVVGDVCGTGPEAAAVTGLARHTLRILGREGYSLPSVLQRLNRAILEEGSRSRFLTVVYGELEPTARRGVRLRLVSAGHPPPLRLRPDGEVTVVAQSQPLLGVLGDVSFTSDEVDLEPGDVLLCVTDGVTERRAGDRLLDDDDGLQVLLADCTGLSAGAVAARIQRAVTEFGPAPAGDDTAILAVRAL